MESGDTMNRNAVIGIDLGGTNIKGALVDFEGRIMMKKKTATLANAGPEAVAGRMGKLIRELEAVAVSSGQKVAGIGIGVPGQPDRGRGEVVFAPNLYWRHVPLVKYLRKELQSGAALHENGGLQRDAFHESGESHGNAIPPVILENDANVAALGEQWKGAGRGSVNMVMVTVGTGIGGGLVLNGRLYSGANGSAGEIGHTVIDPDGPQCSCGRKGCLETLTSATAMVRMAREAIDSGRATELSKPENLEAKDIFMAARAGDSAALEVVNRAVYYLGIGLGNVINILNPDTIVIGGGVSHAGEILFEPLCRHAREFSLEAPAAAVRIIPAELGNDAGVIGAAKLVMDERQS